MDPPAEGPQREKKGAVAAIQPMGGSIERSEKAEAGCQAATATATATATASGPAAQHSKASCGHSA